nr:universal stress protein [Prosthecochloris sp. GSB1]
MPMKTITACIDGSAASTAVCDAALWASRNLGAPISLVHVLEKSESPVEGNLSGTIGLGSREHLLDALANLDEERGRLALEHGKHLLEAAKKRVEKSGAENTSTLQRHGNLVETLQELESGTRLLVIGRQGEAHENSARSVGGNLENIVRALHVPIFVALPGFRKPSSFMIACDGSHTAEKAVRMVASSPLLKGTACHLVTVRASAKSAETDTRAALAQLDRAGFDVTVTKLQGGVRESLEEYRKQNGIGLTVMGAYGHSRIRRFFVGSNTTRMIMESAVPLLLLR